MNIEFFSRCVLNLTRRMKTLIIDFLFLEMNHSFLERSIHPVFASFGEKAVAVFAEQAL